MAANVSSQVNFNPAIVAINNKIAQLQNMTPALNQIGQMAVASTRYRITNSKTDPSGAAWRPMTRATVRQRARRGTLANGLLWDTGRLLRSINYRLVKNTVQVYSSVPYAQYLQFGTTRMPARKFLGWSNADIANMSMIVNAFLAGQTK